MRAEIYRHLKGLGFEEAEAKKMSADFARWLKTLGAKCAKIIVSILQSLLVSLLHSYVLAVLL